MRRNSASPRPVRRSVKNAPIKRDRADQKITLFRGMRFFVIDRAKKRLWAMRCCGPCHTAIAPPPICAPMPGTKIGQQQRESAQSGTAAPRHAPTTYEIGRVDYLGNGFDAGQISCATYTSAAERHADRRTQVSTVASMMLRRGFSASSDSVEIPSNPIYVSTAIEVHPNSAVKGKCRADRRTDA